MRQGEHICTRDYQRLYGTRCFSCDRFIEGEVVSALGKTYHPDCFVCAVCRWVAQPLPCRPLPPPSGPSTPSPGSTPSSHTRHREVQQFVWGSSRAGSRESKSKDQSCTPSLCTSSRCSSFPGSIPPQPLLPFLPSCILPSFDSWQVPAASTQPHSKPSYPWLPRWPSLAYPWPWSLHCFLLRLPRWQSVPAHPLPQAKALLPMSPPADDMPLSTEVSHITVLKPTQPP